MEEGIKNWRFLTNVSLYFENDTRYGNSHTGKRIGTCMRSIKWCHFQWYWAAFHLDFKVRILFNVNSRWAILTMADQ